MRLLNHCDKKKFRGRGGAQPHYSNLDFIQKCSTSHSDLDAGTE
jgi:hypothetical protein